MDAKDSASEKRQQQAVENYLESCGFRVLDRNWLYSAGEKDFILAEHRLLVVFDIRDRSERWYGDSANLITQFRRAQLRRLAVNWLSENGMQFEQVRVDVIGLVYEGTDRITVQHVRGFGW